MQRLITKNNYQAQYNMHKSYTQHGGVLMHYICPLLKTTSLTDSLTPPFNNHICGKFLININGLILSLLKGTEINTQWCVIIITDPACQYKKRQSVKRSKGLPFFDEK